MMTHLWQWAGTARNAAGETTAHRKSVTVHGGQIERHLEKRWLRSSTHSSRLLPTTAGRHAGNVKKRNTPPSSTFYHPLGEKCAFAWTFMMLCMFSSCVLFSARAVCVQPLAGLMVRVMLGPRALLKTWARHILSSTAPL